MRVISRRTLRLFWEMHPTARPGLLMWYERMTKGDFSTFNILRQTFPSADLVGNFVVFNIAGNNFRLITYFDFEDQMVFIRDVLTHAEYDKENWKNDNWYQS
jgi:mRNA interferase HigB